MKKEELLAVAKPILFNTQIAKAILEENLERRIEV